MTTSTVRQSSANRELRLFIEQVSSEMIQLACYASIPVAINPDFLHLIRINFCPTLSFGDESKFLLSKLCYEIGNGLYEIQPEVRAKLLQRLFETQSVAQIEKSAALLWKYSTSGVWQGNEKLARAQQLTALNLLAPDKAREWLDAAETERQSGLYIDNTRDWFIAIREEVYWQATIQANASDTQISNSEQIFRGRFTSQNGTDTATKLSNSDLQQVLAILEKSSWLETVETRKTLLKSTDLETLFANSDLEGTPSVVSESIVNRLENTDTVIENGTPLGRLLNYLSSHETLAKNEQEFLGEIILRYKLNQSRISTSGGKYQPPTPPGIGALSEPGPLPPGSRIPYSRNPLFSGRRHQLLSMARELLYIPKNYSTLLLSGRDGVGKTQLAIEFAFRFGRFFNGVHWIDMRYADGISAEVANCGALMQLRSDYDSLPIDMQVQETLAAWSKPEPRLFIFDDCEDFELVARWHPKGNGAKVIITSRQRSDLATSSKIYNINLEGLEREESISLLRNYEGAISSDNSLTNNEINQLAAELGDLPIDLAHAGKYIETYGFLPTKADLMSLRGETAKTATKLNDLPVFNADQKTKLTNFIINHFNNRQLDTLRSNYFPELVEELNPSMRKAQKVASLINYLEQTDHINDLYSILSNERPNEFSKEFSINPPDQANIPSEGANVSDNRLRRWFRRVASNIFPSPVKDSNISEEPDILTWFIVCVKGPIAGRTFPFKRSWLTIGRDPDNDIVIDSALVSRYHAMITISPGGITLADLGSANGTWIAGRRIVELLLLSKNDTFQIGSCVFALTASGQMESYELPQLDDKHISSEYLFKAGELNLEEYKSLSRYEITQLIGEGGAAYVYLVKDRAMGIPAALKVLRQAADPYFKRRFSDEIKIGRILSHRHIVHVYAAGEDNGLYYIIMEYMSGGSLRERMSRPIKLKNAISIIAQIGSALDYAHSNGVIHRSVKPEDILFTEDDVVKLSDFGIATLTRARRITREGMLVGTPEYMSYEQVKGMTLDGRSDQYSLGVVLYEMLTGRPPFMGSPLNVVEEHISSAPIPPRRLNPAIPPYVEAVIMRTLSKDRNKRYDKLADMIADLRYQESAETSFPEGVTHPATSLARLINLKTGQSWIIPNSGLLVGRSLFSDPLLSRRHAIISKVGDSFFIEDLGSSNGTFVDGIRVKETTILRPGCEIRLGPVPFQFIVGE